MQLRTPCGGGIQGGDPGQFQRGLVDGAPGIRARVTDPVDDGNFVRGGRLNSFA